MILIIEIGMLCILCSVMLITLSILGITVVADDHSAAELHQECRVIR